MASAGPRPPLTLHAPARPLLQGQGPLPLLAWVAAATCSKVPQPRPLLPAATNCTSSCKQKSDRIAPGNKSHRWPPTAQMRKPALHTGAGRSAASFPPPPRATLPFSGVPPAPQPQGLLAARYGSPLSWLPLSSTARSCPDARVKVTPRFLCQYPTDHLKARK